MGSCSKTDMVEFVEEEYNIQAKQVIHLSPEYEIILTLLDTQHFLNQDYATKLPSFIHYVKAYLKEKKSNKIAGYCSYICIQHKKVSISDIRELLPYFSFNYIIPLKELPLYLFRECEQIKILDDFFMAEELDISSKFLKRCLFSSATECIGVMPVYYQDGNYYQHINQDRYLKTEISANEQHINKAIRKINISNEYKRMLKLYDKYLSQTDKKRIISQIFHSLWIYDSYLHKKQKSLNDYSFSEIVQMN